MKIQIVVFLIGLISLQAEVYQGASSDDVLQGGAGNDLMILGGGNDFGAGLAGDDVIFGESGHDELYGDAGNDILVGGSASSIGDTGPNDFTGGAGNDLLLGGMYGDTYRYNIGDGLDRIREPGTSAGETDRIVFGTGITTASLGFSRDGADLFVELGGGDILRIESWFGSSGGEFQIEEFQFDSGPPLLGATLPFDGTTWNGTASADTYTAPVGANYWILGAGGNDTLTGAPDLDVIVGGPGNDGLYGRDGSDGLYGEVGSDTLNGENGDDSLVGGADNDTLNGGAGNDSLLGGLGNDALNGGLGSDSYTWSMGDGDDVIQDDTTYNERTAVNQLVLGPGVLPSDVTTESVPSSSLHLKFVIKQSGVSNGSVTVINWARNHDGTTVKHSSTWRIDFADGTTWNGAILGTPLTDTLIGSPSTDQLNGGAGDDTLIGLDGDDALAGEANNDILWGGNGNDTLSGGDGNDTLYGEGGNDVMDGGLGIDTIVAGAGSDQLQGASGADTLYGELGNDSYFWSMGDGDDVIQDDTTYNERTAVNHLVLGPGVLPSDVTTESVPSSSLHLKFVIKQSGVTNGSVTVINWARNHDGTTVKHSSTWRIDFADGTTWNGAILGTPLADTLIGSPSTDQLNGGAGDDILIGLDGDDALAGEANNDILWGGNGNDTLSGGDGNDTLYGEGGNDVMDGGLGIDTIVAGAGSDQLQGASGADTLYGELGNDSYFWSMGDGDDVIQDDTTYSERTAVNHLVLGPGVLPSDVTTESVPSSSLHLKFVIKQSGVTNGSVTVINWSRNHDGTSIKHSGTWRIDFANGTTWNGASVGTPLADILTGTSGADIIRGAGGNDSITGSDGDDVIYGDNGADVLYGNLGNDSLSGDDGDDTLYGNEGDDTLTGGTGADILLGGTGNDLLQGGTGNDILNGEAGSDTYIWSQGDGDDSITESFLETGVDNTLAIQGGIDPGGLKFMTEGSTKLKVEIAGPGSLPSATLSIDNWAALSGSVRFFSRWKLDLGNDGTFRFNNLPTTGNDTVTGTPSNDLLIGMAGGDTLSGGDGSDFLQGGDDDDTLTGGAGDDLLSGGTGNDALSGGEGNDRYYVNLGGGYDTIAEPLSQSMGESNQLVFGLGIDPDLLVVTWSNGDLLIQYESGSGFVRIRNWFTDANRARAIESVKFANGTTWNRTQTEGRIYGSGSGVPNIADLIPVADVSNAINASIPEIVVGLQILTPLK